MTVKLMAEHHLARPSLHLLKCHIKKEEENKKVFDYVFKFIHESGRFDHNETAAQDESL